MLVNKAESNHFDNRTGHMQSRNILSSKCHYQTLGVDSKASKTDIKQAYKALVLKYHPDKNKQDGTKEVFRKVVDAYEVICDDGKRAAYDQGIRMQEQVRKKAYTCKKSEPKSPNQYKKAQKASYDSKPQSSSQERMKDEGSRQRDRQQKKKQEQEKEQDRKFKEDARRMYEQYKKYCDDKNRKNSEPPKRTIPKKKQGVHGSTIVACLIVVMAWFFLPNFSSQSAPDFRLNKNSLYSMPMKTVKLKVPYFVRPAVAEKITPQLQTKIEAQYLKKIEVDCERALGDRQYFQRLAQRQATEQRAEFIIQKAKDVDLSPCKRIIKLLKKHPQLHFPKFPNKISL